MIVRRAKMVAPRNRKGWKKVDARGRRFREIREKKRFRRE